LEGPVVRTARFEQEVEPKRDGAAGQRDHDRDHYRLEAPAAHLRPGHGEAGSHRSSPVMRTLTMASAGVLGPSSGVSSCTRPSISVTTRLPRPGAALGAWGDR